MAYLPGMIVVIVKWVLALGAVSWVVSWVVKLGLDQIPKAIRKHTFIPEIDVCVRLSDKPYFNYRPDIFSVVFSLTSVSGITKVVKGSVRFYNPDNPGEGEEQKVSARQMFEGKTEDFHIPFGALLFYDRVMSGESRLKAECNLTLERPNGELHEQNKRYTYDRNNKIFEVAHG